MDATEKGKLWLQNPKRTKRGRRALHVNYGVSWRAPAGKLSGEGGEGRSRKANGGSSATGKSVPFPLKRIAKNLFSTRKLRAWGEGESLAPPSPAQDACVSSPASPASASGRPRSGSARPGTGQRSGVPLASPAALPAVRAPATKARSLLTGAAPSEHEAFSRLLQHELTATTPHARAAGLPAHTPSRVRPAPRDHAAPPASPANLGAGRGDHAGPHPHV